MFPPITFLILYKDFHLKQNNIDIKNSDDGGRNVSPESDKYPTQATQRPVNPGISRCDC
jgi:hypothetical protein